MKDSVNTTHQTIERRIQSVTSLPRISSQNTIWLINRIEGQWKPRDIEDLIYKWDNLMAWRMKYDAMNFWLMKTYPIDESQDWWIDRLDINQVSMNQNHINLAIWIISKYKKIYQSNGSGTTDFDLMILALKKQKICWIY